MTGLNEHTAPRTYTPSPPQPAPLASSWAWLWSHLISFRLACFSHSINTKRQQHKFPCWDFSLNFMPRSSCRATVLHWKCLIYAPSADESVVSLLNWASSNIISHLRKLQMFKFDVNLVIDAQSALVGYWFSGNSLSFFTCQKQTSTFVILVFYSTLFFSP